ERTDAETWARFRDTASTIGMVTSTALGGSEAVGSNAPTPVVQSSRRVNCEADRNTATGESSQMTVRCQWSAGAGSQRQHEAKPMKSGPILQEHRDAHIEPSAGPVRAGSTVS